MPENDSFWHAGELCNLCRTEKGAIAGFTILEWMLKIVIEKSIFIYFMMQL